MPLTSADLTAIAKAVWTIDGIIPSPDNTPTNPFWEPQRSLADLGVQVRAIEASIASLSGSAPDASVAIAGLDPAQLADAIVTGFGPDGSQEVITALQARLAAPSAPAAPAS